MEEPIGEFLIKLLDKTECSLNPCFSGRTNRSAVIYKVETWTTEVLILVLVEEPIGATYIGTLSTALQSLNPCFSGRTYRSPPTAPKWVYLYLS